jgi:hypothetical protein
MVVFHNRGVLHSVVGAFTVRGPSLLLSLSHKRRKLTRVFPLCLPPSSQEDQVRIFHQCNLAGSSDPTGPTDEDIKQWTAIAA